MISHILQMWYNQYTVSSSSTTVDVMTGNSGCADMNTVCVNVIGWCDIIKSGCDVICIHMMSYILCLCYHIYNRGFMIDYLGVMTEIQWKCCQI